MLAKEKKNESFTERTGYRQMQETGALAWNRIGWEIKKRRSGYGSQKENLSAIFCFDVTIKQFSSPSSPNERKNGNQQKWAIRSMQSQHVLHKIIDVRRCPEMSSLQWVRCAEFHGGEKHQTFLISRADVARTQNTNTYGSPNLKIKKKKRANKAPCTTKKTWKRRAKTTTWPHVTSFGRNWLCAEECVGKAPWWGQMRIGSDFQKKSRILDTRTIFILKMFWKERETDSNDGVT